MKTLDQDVIDKAVSLYVNDKLTAKAVSELLEISSYTVWKCVRNSGNEVRKTADCNRGKVRHQTIKDEEVIKLYMSGKTHVQIASLLGCSVRTIWKYLKRLKITARKSIDYIQTKFDDVLVQTLYMEGKSIAQIAKITNIPRHVLQPFLQKMGITRTTYCNSKGRIWTNDMREKARKKRRLKRAQGLYDHIYLKRTGYTYAEYVKQLPKYKAYSNEVRLITGRQPLHQLENYDKRGKSRKNSDAYQVDHRYSVIEGFKNGIDPNILGHITNLQMLPWRDNLKKKGLCSITLEELISLQKDV